MITDNKLRITNNGFARGSTQHHFSGGWLSNGTKKHKSDAHGGLPSTTFPSSTSGKSGAGFTLLEILVVLGIFSVLAIVIVDVFLLALHSQRQASFRQETVANLRYVMETISRQTRMAEIDYDYYRPVSNQPPAITNPEDRLALRDQDGNSFVYFLDSAKREIKLSVNDGQASPLTAANDVEVIQLLFYIDPITSPFSNEGRCNLDSDCYSDDCTINDPASEQVGYCVCDPALSADNQCFTRNCSFEENLQENLCLPFDVQPRVTVVLGFQSAGVKPEERKTIYLQTTVSSRVYKR